MAESHAKRPIYEKIQKIYGNKVVLIARSFFNETRGKELLNELSSNPLNNSDLTERYLVLNKETSFLF